MKPITSTYLLVLGLFLLSFQVMSQVTTSFTPSAPSAPVGNDIDLELKVSNFTNILSIQFPITFQSSVLQFVSADMFGLPGFVNSNYNVTPGKIAVSWFADLGANPNGVTLPAGTTLIRLRFKVLANGTVPVNISGNTAPVIELINGNGMPVTLNYQNGGSMVTGGSGGPALQGFKIIAHGRDVAPNSNFCIPITVNDFDTLVSMQYAMQWDKNIIRFDSTTSYKLAFLNASNFGGNTSNGTLLLSWYDQNALGISRPDGDTIYRVCFKALGAVGTQSLLTISGNGFPPGTGGAEAIKASGANVWTSQTPINDTVFIKQLGPDPNAPTFTADKDTVPIGGNTCVDIKVSKFKDILSAQFVVTYDQTKVEFQSVQFGANPLGLSLGANFNTTTPGQIRFTWNDPNALGLDLNDGVSIFSVCFKALGPVNSTIPINITSITGFPVEITQEPQGPVTPNLNNGSIFITNAPPPALTLSFGTVTNVNCFGQSTGAINLTIAGGTTPYTVSWSGPNGYTSTATNIANLAAGNYSVTVTSADGQTKTLGPQAVTQPTALMVALTPNSTQNVKCWGDANGAAGITVSGGTTPYVSYVWKNSGGTQVSTVQNPANLPAGTFNVTVTDTRGCTGALANPVVINGPAANMNVNAQKANVTCHGGSDGAINVTVTGGWGSPTISWTPGTVSGFTPTGLAPGGYIPKVTDAGGCEITLSTVNITQPAQPIQYGTPSVTHVLCNGGATGAITVTPSGGNGTPYTVNWNSGALTGATITGLTAGVYTPVVSDSKNCSATLAPITINTPPAITVSDAITNQNGQTANGAINLGVSGGTPPYQFNWSNGATTEDISMLAAGQFTVTITDANNCQTTRTMTVGQDNPLNGSTNVVSVQSACANDGCIKIAISPIAPPPFVLNWNGGTLTNIMTDTAEICNLMPGVYNITVTDAAGNSLALPTQTIQNLPPAIVTPSVQPTNCLADNGFILLTPVPATTQMGYVWNTGATGNALLNIGQGLYTVTITNLSSGCTGVQSFPLECPPPACSATVDSVDCGNIPNGAIDFSFSGADGPNYLYAWSGPNGFTANTEDINTLGAGAYTVTVTDESNNQFTCSYTVPQGSILTITNVNELSNFNGFQVSGFGICDGSASVAVSGNTGAVTFQWSNGATGASTNTLCGGPYSVIATDARGCTAVWTDDLTTPTALAAAAQGVSNFNGFGVRCFETCDGVGRVQAAGGVAPYTVRWPSGQTDVLTSASNFSQAGNLCAGQYAATITDANGIATTASLDITEPDELTLTFSVEAPSGFATCDGEILATAQGGAGVPQFEWTGTNGRTGDEDLAGSLCSGDQVLFVVTDGNGCVATGNERVPYPDDGCLRVRTVLTPGMQDGKNDFLFITCIESVDNSIEIYNRWGQLVFQTTNYDNSDNAWYGTNAFDQPLPEGVYFYILRYTDTQGEQEQRGHINLLR